MKALTAKIGIVLLVAVMVATGYAATVEQVVVRQLWPWSTDVRVEYNVTGVTSPVDISVTAFNGSEQLNAPGLNSAIVGDIYGISQSGVYSFTIDPVKAFGTGQIAMSEFKVHLSLSDSAANTTEVLYKIYDLVGGGCTDVTRGDLLGGKYGTIETNYTAYTGAYTGTYPGFETTVPDVLIWTGVTNDAKYATTHLVMRKISAKGKTFKMGSPADESDHEANELQHNVTMANDFYIGVFEVTQRQYNEIAGSWPSFYSLASCRDTRPLDKITWEAVRGTGSSAAWPGDLSHSVASGSFLYNLRSRLSGTPKLDLPTEAQWEYACRAECTNSWYNGYDSVGTQYPWHVNKIARYAGERGYGPDDKLIGDAATAAVMGTTNGTARVGSYLPNAWGLYDMAGNVAEMCLDWYAEYTSADQTEPVGPSSGSNRSWRGGAITSKGNGLRSALRGSRAPSSAASEGWLGLRLCLTIKE
jgi:formylglycine-generating enzyme required for sulfatase activity